MFQILSDHKFNLLITLGGAFLLPAFALAQTTYYLTNGTTNPQSGSVTYYDMSTVAGSADDGLFTEPLQTAVDYAAEGIAGTYNYYIVPGIYMGSAESSTNNVTTSTGFGWETAAPLACDISAGTWTFSNRFEGNIGAGSPAVYVEVSVYTYNGTSSSLLFNYTDTTNLTGNLSAGTPYSYSFTTSQPAFSGVTGQSLKVEYYTQMVGGSAYAGGYVYLGFDTSNDYVNVPVCPPPTNTQTSTSTSTSTATATNSSTSTATNTATATTTNTATSSASATSTPTATVSNTVTNSATMTPTATSTSTATDTQVNSATATGTSTTTSTATNSSTATATNTSTSTATNTSTNLSTATSTNTVTNTSTNTAVNTSTSTATNTNTSTATSTSTNAATNTSTGTNTATPTGTSTSTNSPTLSCTPTATNTVTDSPTPNIHIPIVIFPNPYTGNGPINIQVPLATPGDIKISIFSLAFRKVVEKEYPNSMPGVIVSMNVQDKNGYELANGLYYVRIQTALGTTLLKLLVLR